MKVLQNVLCSRLCRSLLASFGLSVLAACSALSPTPTLPPAFFSLDNPRVDVAPRSPGATAGAPTLVINPPRAAAGFDSQRIIYLRDAYKLEYFANSEWVDPPARMLGPLLVNALERSGAFRAVIQTPASASADLRLDTQIIRLQQDFHTQPSHARFTLRAYLVDDKTRAVLAWREFDANVPALSDDPYGSVVAANEAVQMVLADLSAFCAEAARRQPPGK